MVAATTVRAVNDITGRWARAAVGERGTVLTAAGVWPLQALLAGPAAGPARAELAAALGLDAEHAPREGRDLLAACRAAEGVDAAVGLWTRRSLALRPDWLAGLPPGSHGELTGDAGADQEAMHAWARRHTDGLIERMPARVDPETLLVLASALLVRTTWQEPFGEYPLRVVEGPWAGRELTGLGRSGTNAEQVRVHTTPAGPLTAVEVAGDNGLDVHLLLGPPDMSGGAVLSHGVAALAGAYATVSGAGLAEGAGPGLGVTTVPSEDGVARVQLTAARFTVRRGTRSAGEGGALRARRRLRHLPGALPRDQRAAAGGVGRTAERYRDLRPARFPGGRRHGGARRRGIGAADAAAPGAVRVGPLRQALRLPRGAPGVRAGARRGMGDGPRPVAGVRGGLVTGRTAPSSPGARRAAHPVRRSRAHRISRSAAGHAAGRASLRSASGRR